MLFVALGVVLWRGAFGVLPSEREIVWRLPLSYSEVRRLEVQVWSGESLLKAEDVIYPHGIDAEPTTKLTMRRGPHRALILVYVTGGAAPLSYTVEFDPRDESTLVLSARKP